MDRRFQFLIVGAITFATFLSCQRGNDLPSSNAPQSRPATNVFAARQLDPEQSRADINRAWDNYLESLKTKRPKDKPVGFSEEQIRFIEVETRQRLPEDLKAFFRTCWSNGKFFNDGFEMMTAEEIVEMWKFLVDLNYVNTVNSIPFDSPAAGTTPTWFEPYLIPLMRYDTYEIHFDIRNGNIIEAMDGPCGILANSMPELLDGLAEQYRAGKSVCLISFEGTEVGPFLKSEMWDVYEP